MASPMPEAPPVISATCCFVVQCLHQPSFLLPTHAIDVCVPPVARSILPIDPMDHTTFVPGGHHATRTDAWCVFPSHHQVPSLVMDLVSIQASFLFAMGLARPSLAVRLRPARSSAPLHATRPCETGSLCSRPRFPPSLANATCV